MEVDTATLRAIVDDRDRMRSEVDQMRGYLTVIADAVLVFGDAAAAAIAPDPPAVARRGRGRHAGPPSWQPRVIEGGRR